MCEHLDIGGEGKEPLKHTYPGPPNTLPSNSLDIRESLSRDLPPCFCHRGRSPQPPAEDDEEDFDETLVAIDTCEW